MLYIGKIFVSIGFRKKVHCYLATRPEVESLRVQSFVVSLKSSTLKGGARISLSIVNSEPPLHLLYTRARITRVISAQSKPFAKIFSREINPLYKKYTVIIYSYGHIFALLCWHERSHQEQSYTPTSMIPSWSAR